MDSSPLEDGDITLLRQSNKFLKELGEAFERVDHVADGRELDSIIRKIEPYQEDPQLLDGHLGDFIPTLSARFLANLHQAPVLQNVSRILYTFAKVRGDKVIIGLLNNEVRWIEPLLGVLTREELPWEQNYVLLLWLSHLMLSPFDLATISSHETESTKNSLKLPRNTPSIAYQVVNIGISHLKAATIERKAASSLLVRLCVRQDMLDLGLLGLVTQWAIDEGSRAAKEGEVHSCLGALTLLSGLVASADQEMLGVHLSSVFRLGQKVLDDSLFASIKTSAVARKLAIKILKSTIIHCLQVEQANLDTTDVVEEVIGALIELLADSDTPVRMASAKALSLITLKLDTDMASEVVDAVTSSFREEIIGHDTTSFFSVNASRWHGIVLTLGHLLHRRAVAPEQIPEVLRCILYALSFEQRSTTGKSVGSNVRDAANYGLWAVSRRYTTAELQSIPTRTFSIHTKADTENPIQYIALNLLVSACFDQDGNVRRGSSAALQELIGRHPNTIHKGISLVQVVDYQAVGLHARATTKVAKAVSELHPLYERSLIEALFTWRGLSAASQASRVESAVVAGLLVLPSPWFPGEEIEGGARREDYDGLVATAHELITRIRSRLVLLKPRDQEERQGLLLSSSWVLSSILSILSSRNISQGSAAKVANSTRALMQEGFLSIPEFSFVLSHEFNPRSPRAELVISATLRLLGQIAGIATLTSTASNLITPEWSPDHHQNLIARCLARSDEIVLAEVPQAVSLSIPMLSSVDANKLVRQWLSDLAPENKKPGVRESARILALGAALPVLPLGAENADTESAIWKFLLERFMQVDTEAKIVVLQSLKLVVGATAYFAKRVEHHKAACLEIASSMILLALHDYTISERGDVGSLVRLAGLAALQDAWKNGLLLQDAVSGPSMPGSGVNVLDLLHLNVYSQELSNGHIGHLRASVLRLSLEKLDKVRLAAVDCWRAQRDGIAGSNIILKDQELRVCSAIMGWESAYLLTYGAPLPPRTIPNHDISSTAYFYNMLSLLTHNTLGKHIKLRIVEGLCSTAGGAGLGASQNLLNVREALQLFSDDNAPEAASNRATVSNLLKNVVDINVKLENDQRLVAILEVIAFVAERGQLSERNAVPPRSFLATIQRSHFKSRNIRKLQVCLDIYRAMAYIEEVRADVLKIVVGMLLHPLPAVRIAAAETLVSICGSYEMIDVLSKMDWTQSTSEGKETVTNLKRNVAEGKFVLAHD